MILKFSTKSNASGNRYFLGFDTDKKIFSRESAHWYCMEDVTEIKRSDRKKMIEALEADGYKEVNNI